MSDGSSPAVLAGATHVRRACGHTPRGHAPIGAIPVIRTAAHSGAAAAVKTSTREFTMGYADPAYLATLPHLGRRVDLAASGAAVFLRSLPSPMQGLNAIGPQPWLSCDDESQLEAELDQLIDPLVQGTLAVLDPLAGAPSARLRRAFPDCMRQVGTHWQCDFSRPLTLGSETLSLMRDASRTLEFRVLSGENLRAAAVDLRRLFERCAMDGMVRHWPSQLHLQAMTAVLACRDGLPVAAQLWLSQQGWAVRHLDSELTERALSVAGHGLMMVACDHFKAAGNRGLWLGGVRGALQSGAPPIWGNGQCPLWMGGRIGRGAVTTDMDLDVGIALDD